MGYLEISSTKNCFDYKTDKKVYKDVCAYFEAVGFVRNINAKAGEPDKLKIHYNDWETEGDVCIELADISDERRLLAALGAQKLFIPPIYAPAASRLLTEQARDLARKPDVVELHHNKLGWHKYNDTWTFLYNDKTFLPDEKQSICDREFMFRAGSYSAYQKMLDEIVFKSKELTLAYVLGFSAIIISRLNKEKIADLGTVVINVSGRSTMGKTTMEQLLISPFGNPVFNKCGLGITHAGTLNGILDAMEGIHGLPRVIDDIQQNASINMTELLYTISQEETKMRSGEKWNQNTDGWSGLVVVSSEFPLMERMKVQQGTYPRLLNATNIQWTSSAEEAETIKRVVAQNYGWSGSQFIDYIRTYDFNRVFKNYEECLKRVKPLMSERDGLSDRIATRFAAIMTTYELVKEWLWNRLPWTAEEIIEPLIESEQETVQERNPAEKLLQIVKTYAQTYKNIYFDMEYKKKAGTRYGEEIQVLAARQGKQGRILVENSGKDWTICIYQERMKTILKERGFNEWGTAAAELKSRGILMYTEEKKSNGKITQRTRKLVDGVWCNVFKVEMPLFKWEDLIAEMEEEGTEEVSAEKENTQSVYREYANDGAPITPDEIFGAESGRLVQEEKICMETPVDTTEWNEEQSLEEIFGTEGENHA